MGRLWRQQRTEWDSRGIPKSRKPGGAAGRARGQLAGMPGPRGEAESLGHYAYLRLFGSDFQAPEEPFGDSTETSGEVRGTDQTNSTLQTKKKNLLWGLNYLGTIS